MKKIALIIAICFFVLPTVQANPLVADGTLFVNNKPLYKQSMTTLKKTNNPPVRFTDLNLYYVTDTPITEKQSRPDLLENQRPLQHVVSFNGAYVMTKFYYRGQFNGFACGGGQADLLQVWQRDARGKMTLVTKDIVSSAVSTPIAVVNRQLYWVKATDQALSNYTIMSKSGAVMTNVDDVFLFNHELYYIKKNKLFSLTTKKAVPLKRTLATKTQCKAANYRATNENLIVESEETGRNKRFDIWNVPSTKLTTLVTDEVALFVDYNVKENIGVAEAIDGQLILYKRGENVALPFTRYDIVAIDWAKQTIYYMAEGQLQSYHMKS